MKEWERARDRDRDRSHATPTSRGKDGGDVRTHDDRTNAESDSRVRDLDVDRGRDVDRRSRTDRGESSTDRSRRDDDHSRHHDDDRGRRHVSEVDRHSRSRDHSPPSDDSHSDDDSSARTVCLLEIFVIHTASSSFVVFEFVVLYFITCLFLCLYFCLFLSPSLNFILSTYSLISTFLLQHTF